MLSACSDSRNFRVTLAVQSTELSGRLRGWQDGAGTPGVSDEQIEEIVGEGARDRGGKGNANVGDGGVAFVLSSSGPSPGGSETVSHPPRLHALNTFAYLSHCC